MTNNLIQSIDRLIPKKILENSDLSMEDMISCRVFVCVLVISAILSAMFALIFLSVHLISGDLQLSPAIAGAASFILSLLLYVFFYRTEHLHASTLLFSTVILLITVICIAISGGTKSTVMPVLISIPVISALIGGRYEGVYNFSLVIIIGGIFLVLDHMGFVFMQLANPEYYNDLMWASWAITLLLNATCLFISQYMHEQLRAP